MSIRKNLFNALMMMGLGSFSILASAQGLHIVNNTNADSTSRINGGLCSSTFGDSGITKHRDEKGPGINDVSESLVKLACFGHSSDCRADIYMTNNCSGSVIGTVSFDVNTGTKSVTSSSTTYQITSAPHSFAFMLDEVA